MRKVIKLTITPSMQRAAELRGVPLTLWLQGTIHRAAWTDIVAARDILEEAGFADRNDRLRREQALRDAYRRHHGLDDYGKTVLDDLPVRVKRKPKQARIEIAPPLPDAHHTRFYGPEEPCGERDCTHCYPPAVA
jgi:hypothetical protein